MGLVLHLEKRRMSERVKKIFNDAETGNATIFIPAMVMAEILYLTERGRISISLNDIDEYIQSHPNCREFSLSFTGIEKAMEISDIPELHDRLIAGAASLLGVPLITNDPVIAASQFVKTVW
jgi:PIN domain nuclease of toxin-antitoxin system